MESADGDQRKEGVSKGQTAHFMILKDSSHECGNCWGSSKLVSDRDDVNGGGKRDTGTYLKHMRLDTVAMKGLDTVAIRRQVPHTWRSSCILK